MLKTGMYTTERKMTDDNLNIHIRNPERSKRVLMSLLLIPYRYDRDFVRTLARSIGTTRVMCYS
jgi:hypothetical protein